MLEFFRAGGMPMWFVLIFGLVGLGAAIAFALRPDSRRVDAIRALTWATIFSVGAGMFSAIATVGSQVPKHPELMKDGQLPMVLLEGLSESMSAGILGFSMLSLTWLVMAVGHRRLAHETPV